MMALRKMMELAITPWEEATAWLLIGAIFFAMRSCKYLRTTVNEEGKRTRILRMRNISFSKGGRRVKHHEKGLEDSDIVIITFEFQKNDRRDEQVHMFKTEDSILNPVKAWAKTVQRVRKYSASSDDSTVCTYYTEENERRDIQADHVRGRLRAIVKIIGEESLGFGVEEVGLHSIRSGGAMAMFLSGTSPIVIKKIGRWSSEAFLEYIREQVEEFTAGVSQKMLEFEDFNNLRMRPTTQIKNKHHNNNEDGPKPVPHSVIFSRLALEGESKRRPRRRNRK